MAGWIKVIRCPLVLFLLIGCMVACDSGTKPEPEPAESDRLIVEPVVVSATTAQELLNELNQSVAPLSDGGFAVVWTSGVYPSRQIMMQWLDLQGNLRQPTGAKQVNVTANDAGDAVVIARPGGGAYVAFSEMSPDAYMVKVQAFDAYMAPLWLEPRIAAYPTGGWGFQKEPCLVSAPAGDVYVSFASYNMDEKNTTKCQRLDPAGKRLWGEVGMTLCPGYGGVSYPRAVADNVGGLYVFWLNLRDYNAPVREHVLLEGQHLGADGNRTWGSQPKVIHMTNNLAQAGYSHSQLMAASDGLGGAVVAWQDDADINDSQYDALAQRVNLDGQLLWSQGIVVNDPSLNCQLDQIVAAKDGGAFIANYDTVGSSIHRLWMQRLGSVGEKMWGDSGKELSDPSQPRFNYSVRGYFTGSFLNLCWIRQYASYSFDFDVMMGRFKADGTPLDPAGGVVVDDTPDKQFIRGMVYNDVSDEYFVLWEDSRRSLSWDDMDIYGAILKEKR